MHLTELEKRFLKEVLDDCKTEFETLSLDREWFCTKVIEQINEALQILEERIERQQDETPPWTE